MAYDELLAARVRAALSEENNVTEKKMFGGLAFLLRGNMICGVTNDDLMLRVGAARYAMALALPHAREMDFTGKPLKGYVFVAAAGCQTAAALERWLVLARENAQTLPTKQAVDKKAPKQTKR